MIIALNNKCNLTKTEFLNYQKQLATIKTDNEMILCPTYLYINAFNLKNMKLGAQNVSSEECGAYTGEVSATQLKYENVSYCIVGHSERRQYQQESNEQIAKKVENLLINDIKPILCVGETKTERLNKKAKGVVEEEIKLVISRLDSFKRKELVIAYEPLWAIGTGIIPSNTEITEMIKVIKKILPENKVLYGGSVNEENIEQLKTINIIDGYLLGGLSLKPNKLKKFLEKLENKTN